MKHRIIITFPQNARLTRTMAYDVQDACRSLGHETLLLDYFHLGDDFSSYKPALFDGPTKEWQPTVFFTFNDYGITSTQ